MAVVSLLWRIGGGPRSKTSSTGYGGSRNSAMSPFINLHHGETWKDVSNTCMWDLQNINITGIGNIGTQEAFGLLSIAALIGMTGIATAEAFGTPTVTWAGLFKGPMKLHVELGVTLLTRVFW